MKASNKKNVKPKQTLYTEKEWLRRADETREEWDARVQKMIKEVDKVREGLDQYLKPAKAKLKKYL